jgi:phage-related protein
MKKLFYFILILSGFTMFSSCQKDDGDSQDNDQNYFGMEMLDISTNQPHQVNILFRVYDENGVGVPDLSTYDFNIYENDQPIGSEASATIAPFGDIPFEIKTVLLLDVSISVQENLSQIKEAAISLVNNMTDYQEIAIYTFSSTPELIQDFTSNQTELEDAINSIQIGTSSTNLYGSIVMSASRINEIYSTSQIIAGNLIVLTDGDDTQGSTTLSQALSATSGKDVYMLGLGNEMDQSIMEQFGTFYNATNISQLETEFLNILNDIEKTAQSVYWLYYQSPKRGDNYHEIKIDLTDNSNTDIDRNITGTFNSASFGDPIGTSPNTPTPVSPTNGQTINNDMIQLNWNCSDPDGDPLTYDMYFGTTENPPLVSQGQSENYYAVTLDENQTYYWKIVAHDNNFNVTSSPIWNFTFSANPTDWSSISVDVFGSAVSSSNSSASLDQSDWNWGYAVSGSGPTVDGNIATGAVFTYTWTNISLVTTNVGDGFAFRTYDGTNYNETVWRYSIVNQEESAETITSSTNEWGYVNISTTTNANYDITLTIDAANNNAVSAVIKESQPGNYTDWSNITIDVFGSGVSSANAAAFADPSDWNWGYALSSTGPTVEGNVENGAVFTYSWTNVSLINQDGDGFAFRTYDGTNYNETVWRFSIINQIASDATIESTTNDYGQDNINVSVDDNYDITLTIDAANNDATSAVIIASSKK